MPTILPVSDLRTYTEVLRRCQPGEMVYLTRNGRGKYVLMEISDYEKLEQAGKQRRSDGLPDNQTE
ncbi:MAG: type II toxin-antitoxin system prevent-host-death family antitoxin [Blautia sp.]|nr:type II toxin-antitoxin system prevent-host-death family antitoxin [Blautia sp.]